METGGNVPTDLHSNWEVGSDREYPDGCPDARKQILYISSVLEMPVLLFLRPDQYSDPMHAMLYALFDSTL